MALKDQMFVLNNFLHYWWILQIKDVYTVLGIIVLSIWFSLQKKKTCFVIFPIIKLETKL